MLIIGRNPVIETIKFNPGSIEKIVILESSSDQKIKEIIKTAEKLKIDVEHRTKKDFEKLFDKRNKSDGISQGIVAEVSEFVYSELSSLLVELKNKSKSIILVLDEIQDPHNLGAIIRTAAACNSDAVIISEKNSAKINHTVIKSSSGAVNYIKIVQAPNIYKTLLLLKSENVNIIGTSLNAVKTHFDLIYTGKLAILFGNEGKGLRKNLLKLCDEVIKIPIDHRIDSLNVSVAAGVILFEALRQRYTSVT